MVISDTRGRRQRGGNKGGARQGSAAKATSARAGGVSINHLRALGSCKALNGRGVHSGGGGRGSSSGHENSKAAHKFRQSGTHLATQPYSELADSQEESK